MLTAQDTSRPGTTSMVGTASEPRSCSTWLAELRGEELVVERVLRDWPGVMEVQANVSHTATDDSEQTSIAIRR